jgi:autotransporter-associated beta strand protein
VEGTNNFFEAQTNLTIGAGVANSIELASGGALTFNLNSVLLSGAISGAGSLSNTSTGTMTLSGVNSHTGGTTVAAGVLTVSGSGTFGASTGSLTASGGTLDLAGGSWTAGTVNITGGIIQPTGAFG